MRKHRPPSQIRYEKSHPTISFRLDAEVKKRLEKVLEGKSFADFVKEGLGVREREKKRVSEAYNEGYSNGFAEGYERAENEFLVYVPCAICGGDINVYREDDKMEIARVMNSRGWCHYSCKDAQRRQRR